MKDATDRAVTYFFSFLIFSISPGIFAENVSFRLWMDELARFYSIGIPRLTAVFPEEE
jgi:hypothetical protein